MTCIWIPSLCSHPWTRWPAFPFCNTNFHSRLPVRQQNGKLCTISSYTHRSSCRPIWRLGSGTAGCCSCAKRTQLYSRQSLLSVEHIWSAVRNHCHFLRGHLTSENSRQVSCSNGNPDRLTIDTSARPTKRSKRINAPFADSYTPCGSSPDLLTPLY